MDRFAFDPSQCDSIGGNAENALAQWAAIYLNEDYFSTDLWLLPDDIVDVEAFVKKIQNLRSRIPVLSGYCAKCRSFLDNWHSISHGLNDGDPRFVSYTFEPVPGTGNLVKVTVIPYLGSTSELEASSQNGCHFCRLVMQHAAAHPNWLTLSRKVEQRLNHLGKDTTIFVFARTSLRNNYQIVYFGYPGRSLHHLHEFYWNRNLFGIDVLPVADSSGVFSLGKDAKPLKIRQTSSLLDYAETWLTACSKTHESCVPSALYRLPTRLIEVGEGDHVRVVTTTDWTTKPQYATLSHSWGQIDFLKLKQDLLQEFQDKIALKKLTKTFQDAIFITRRLNIKYIWIDSLCIIQDSSQDWEAESALMSSVYGGSTINIAAAAALDGNDGCFMKPADFVGKVRVPKKDHLKGYDFFTQRPGNRGFGWMYRDFHLYSRAWTLQEMMLSSRTLHFGKGDLFWDCKSKEACESFPEGLPPVEDLLDPGSPERPSIAAMWSKVVFKYSSAKLTHSSDKLVALSGIAKAVQAENNDQYLAGMWRQDIEFQLCWSSCPPHGNAPKLGPESHDFPPRPYRAPTWSWLSLDTPVFYWRILDLFKKQGRRLAHVIEAHTIVSGPNEFGNVSGGSITLRCSAMTTGKIGVKHEIFENKTYDCFHVRTRTTLGSDEIEIPVHADWRKINGCMVYLLPLLEMAVKPYSGRVGDFGGVDDVDIETAFAGLLLKPTNTVRGQYQRVGTWRLDRKGPPASNKMEWVIAETDCVEISDEPQYENEKYIITII